MNLPISPCSQGLATSTLVGGRGSEEGAGGGRIQCWSKTKGSSGLHAAGRAESGGVCSVLVLVLVLVQGLVMRIGSTPTAREEEGEGLWGMTEKVMRPKGPTPQHPYELPPWPPLPALLLSPPSGVARRRADSSSATRTVFCTGSRQDSGQVGRAGRQSRTRARNPGQLLPAPVSDHCCA